MRRIFTLLLVTLLTFRFAAAQAVLDSTMAPAFETTILSVYLDDPSVFLFEKTGEDLIWDFTPYGTADTDTVYYDDPANTQYSNEFPDASLAVFQDDESIGYIRNTAEKYELLGAAALIEDSVYVLEFDPPTILIDFPYTYGSSIFDTTEFVITDSGEAFGFPAIDSVQYKVSIINDRLVQAWGTLILPNASYEGTLLEKSITTQIDSLWMKVPFFGWIPMGDPEIYTDSAFRWLTDVVLHPYAELYYDEGEIGSVSYFFDHTVSAPSMIVKNAPTVHIFPNPVQNNFTVRAVFSHDAQIIIYDMSGKTVHRQRHPAGKDQTLIDAGKLKPGFYNLVIRNHNQRSSIKFIRLNN